MKLIKKLIMYVVVLFIVFILLFMFVKLFSFDKNKNIEEVTIPEVTDIVVNKLYRVLPTTNKYSPSTIYTKDYRTKSNISYNTMGMMTLNFINTFDEFKLELVSDDERNSFNGNLLYKINKDIFLNDSKVILGKEVSFKPDDLELSDNLKVKLMNDYYYFYDITNDESDFVYYKQYKSFTVTDNNKTIKIYEYYLRCSKSSTLCYDSEKDEDKNSSIRYYDNLNILDYKDYLKVYEHVFEYQDNNYAWVSTQSV